MSYRLILAMLLSFYCLPTLATKIQILHTNDLHSYLKSLESDSTKGGLARIKKILDKWRAWGLENNLPTFVFDGGDFLEGNLYYKAQNGLKTMQAMEMLGFDGVALGNHDYLMGANDLNSLLKMSNPQFDILVANVDLPKQFDSFHQYTQPYKSFSVDGVTFAVMGLTTDSKLFSWRISEGKIESPFLVGKKLAKKLKRKHDFVFSLNHIGLDSDKLLASVTKDIDLIIGGHSHTLLEKPVYVLNQRWNKVPIVQVGEHGHYIGRMIVDLEKGSPLKVLDYQLLEVVGPEEDENIQNLVREADDLLNQIYDDSWLNKVVGFSEIPLVHTKKGTTPWGDFIADATRESISADIGVHTVGFIGHDHNPGAITRRMIIGSYPRFFEFDHQFGWNIYKAKISGPMLKLAMEIIINSGAPVNISGLEIKYHKEKELYKIDKLVFDDKGVDLTKIYTVAIPEGIARGGPHLTALYPAILSNTKKTNVSIWQAIEDKLKNHGPIKHEKREKKVLRTMIP